MALPTVVTSRQVGLCQVDRDLLDTLRGAVEAQAVDRTHRIGQRKTVMVYRLVSHDTIETKVMELKARKQKLFASVMGDDSQFGSALTADDIRGLLGV